MNDKEVNIQNENYEEYIENNNNYNNLNNNEFNYQRKEDEEEHEIYQEGTNDNNNNKEMEIISEDENEDGIKNKDSNLKVEKIKINLNEKNKEDYNKMFDEIMKKNKDNLIFKKDNNNNSFKPLSEMEKRPKSNLYNSNTKSIQFTEKNSQVSKIPIELSLYKEAEKRKEKREKIEYNNMMNIMLNASKVKMSNNSHKIAINKIEKMIDDTIRKYENDKKITFINAGEILTDLKIFRETFPKDDKNNNNNNNNNNKNNYYQSYKDIQLEMINTKESEIRKQKEVNFYEQLWLTLNPGNNKFIKSDIFSEILKILLTPVNANIKEISEILKQFLLTAFFLNSNPEEVKKYISPITEKEISDEEIWPIEKLVKEFLSLKENLLAYQGLKHFNKSMQKEIDNTKKELSFKPKINEDTSNWNYYSERLPALIEREKLRQQVLEEMKKENEEKDLKECTFKQKINEDKKKIRKNSQNDINSNISIFDKLYTTDKGKYERLKKLKEEDEKKEELKEMEFCTFKPKLISQQSLKKSLNSTERPKGFDEFQKKMRDGIMKTALKKYKENRIPVGENYEKIKKANIQPFDITDLRNKNKDKNNDKKNEEFFTIQIKIPSGRERQIKVYLSEDPYDVADNFCKTYCLKNEVKERLAKTILNFRNLYLQKNHIQNKKNDNSKI